MNHIVLLGNGFDLAHGLKTSYKDFLLWYLKKIAESVEQNHFYEDDIIKVYFNEGNDIGSVHIGHRKPEIKNGSLSNSPESLFDLLKFHKYIVEKKSILTTELITNITEAKWVDIESLYYSIVIRIYKGMAKEKTNALNQYLINLNKSFNQIIIELEKYLKTIKVDELVNINPEIHNHFDEIISQLGKTERNKVYVINFNYTSTMKLYVDNSPLFQDKIIINHIHGSLNNTKPPIIFGYGDETDPHYEEIEKLNENEFLKFMKSFGYATTNNYQNIIRFLNSQAFHVHIMGHSCGLSDRVLLKTIFEHNYCQKINILYYQQDQNKNDYITKYMDISRHFSLNNKSLMRKKIIPLENSKALLPIKEKTSQNELQAV